MPNRIIKESAFESDRISGLSDFAFRLWVGLITQADDAGRGDARPAILKGRLFALRERVTVKDIDQALHAVAAAGCVSLYKVGGKPYYQFPRWADHQRVRDVKPKYPGPEDADAENDVLRQSAAVCGSSPQSAADCGSRARPRAAANPIQSESNPNPNPNPNTRDALTILTDFADGQLCDEELTEALRGFVEMRKQIKKPLTPNAAQLIIKKLREFQRDDWVPIINQSVMNSWQGLFPLKDGGGTTGGASRRVRESNAQCQKHNEVSAGMLAAAREMLEEEF